MNPPFGPAMVAAIDLGTNAFRLLIADIGPDRRLRVKHSERAVPRLGTGIARTGRLDPGAMERSLDALRQFRSVIDRYPVDAVVAAATSAAREAGDADAFLQRIKRDVGFDVEVLSGQEEARRTWLGVLEGLNARERIVEQALVLDVGGGSTEIIRVRDGRFERALSLDLGVVKLTERYLHHDPPESSELAELDAEVRAILRTATTLGEGLPRPTLVGTAGTVTAVAALHLGLTSYQPSLIHDAVVPREALMRIGTQLQGMTSTQRRNLPAIGRGREDVVIAGVRILQGVLDAFGVNSVLVSEYGLREGLIIDWLHRAADIRDAAR